MSTQDNASDNRGLDQESGVNAYKVNRNGLVPPAPAAAPRAAGNPAAGATAAAAPSAETLKASKNRLAMAAAGFAALLAVAGAVWMSVRHGGGQSGGEIGAAVMRGTAPAAELPAYRALVVGINQYGKGGGDTWQPLNSARGDAEEIARTLATDYGFHVQTLLDGEASRSAVLNALDEMATSGSDGADLIYFAGHGFFDDTLKEGYWIPADARKTVDGRHAKEDWIWNSTITRLLNASRARHVLVISDACYSGSLFRGDEPLRAQGGMSWYEKAFAKPSRYLITSGGIEPVLDSGAGHSVFAQQVINFLKHTDRTVFSANDLGLSLRERVASLTGQMVQMGPLPVSAHAGGEFVFVRQMSGVRLASAAPSANAGGGKRGIDEADRVKARQAAARDAVELKRAGAAKAAGALAASLLRDNAQDRLARSVADYVARGQRQEERDELRKLISAVEAKGKAAGKSDTGARPRVLACLGPVMPSSGTNPEAEGEALMYRILLRTGLEERAGIRVIEREEIETLLQEQNLGVSDLADPRARLAIGKLLPASLLLLGDLLPTAQGDKLFLRLVDTETTQVLASFSSTRKEDELYEDVCTELAGRVSDKIVESRPLQAQVTAVEGDLVKAGLGHFHGVRDGQVFDLVHRAALDKKSPEDYKEEIRGTATVSGASEFSCELTAVWGKDQPQRAQNIWVREKTLGHVLPKKKGQEE